MQPRAVRVGRDERQLNDFRKRGEFLGIAEARLFGAERFEFHRDQFVEPTAGFGGTGQIAGMTRTAQRFRLPTRDEQHAQGVVVSCRIQRRGGEAREPGILVGREASEQAHDLGGLAVLPRPARLEGPLQFLPTLDEPTTSGGVGHQRPAGFIGVAAQPLDRPSNFLPAFLTPGFRGLFPLPLDRRDLELLQPVCLQGGACAFVHKMMRCRTLRLIIVVPGRGARLRDSGIFSRDREGVGAQAVLQRIVARPHLAVDRLRSLRLLAVFSTLLGALFGGEAHRRVFSSQRVSRGPRKAGPFIRHYRETRGDRPAKRGRLFNFRPVVGVLASWRGPPRLKW
jgi:hypothetical protein